VRRAIGKYWRDAVALLALFLLAVGIGGYILSQQRLRFPFVEDKPQVIKVELEDAQAVTPGQGQTVRVAGVEVGAIGKVKVEDGVAVVDMEILPEYNGLIRQDATVLLRPKTALKDMLLEVDPGEGKPVPDGGRLPVANTSPDIDPDEIFASLDTDTRSYLKVLISSGGQGLDGHGEDLRQTLLRLEPLHRDLARLNGAVAGRRASLKKLIRDYGEIVQELDGKDAELVRLVRGSNEVFSALAAEESNVSATVNKLPGTLRQSASTLAKVDTLGDRLGPALNALRPAFRRLDETNAKVRPFVTEAAPILRDQIRPFTRRAKPYTASLGRAARDTSRALPDLTTSLSELNRFFNIGAYNPGGAEGLSGDLERDRDREEGYLYWLAWTAQNGVSLFNTSDATGPYRRLTLCGVSLPSAASQLQGAIEQLLASNPAQVAEVPSIVDSVASSGFGTCEF
jgi:phospholipid/cholesterol/gamma-HCH transport system substrate-binding protein